MVTYPLSNLSDDEGDDVEKGEIKNDGKSQGCSPSVDEEDEDWEQEIMQLNNLRPYGPEDLAIEDIHLKMPFNVPDHRQSEVKYIPSIHHVPPVRFIQADKVELDGDQFEDAEE